MQRKQFIEFSVGLFLLLSLFALVVLALQVSGVNLPNSGKFFHISAEFDNIGDLKVRSPVVVAGVKVGEVESISLNQDNFRANVKMRLNLNKAQLPADSSARVLTHGLLGSNYIGITPGFADTDSDYLNEGSVIIETQPAIILENLVGHLIFNMNDKK